MGHMLMRFKIQQFFAIGSLTLFTLGTSCKHRSYNAQPKQNKKVTPSELYFENIANDLETKIVTYPGATDPVTYGLEYEGMSPKIWNFYGLTSNKLTERIAEMPPFQQAISLRYLLSEMFNNGGVIWEIKMENGRHALNKPDFPTSVPYDTLLLEELYLYWKKYLVQAGPSPMSHMSFDIRTKFMNNFALKKLFLEDAATAKINSNKKIPKRRDYMPYPFRDFSDLIPIEGLSIGDTENFFKVKDERGGIWELNSVPKPTLRSFKSQLTWFNTQFGSTTNQHKRFVFGLPPNPDAPQYVDALSPRTSAYFMGGLLNLYQGLYALEVGDNLIESRFLKFKPQFNEIKLDEHKFDWAALRQFKDEFFIPSHSYEIRYGLGTASQVNVVFGLLLKYIKAGPKFEKENKNRLNLMAKIEPLKSTSSKMGLNLIPGKYQNINLLMNAIDFTYDNDSFRWVLHQDVSGGATMLENVSFNPFFFDWQESKSLSPTFLPLVDRTSEWTIFEAELLEMDTRAKTTLELYNQANFKASVDREKYIKDMNDFFIPWDSLIFKMSVHWAQRVRPAGVLLSVLQEWLN